MSLGELHQEVLNETKKVLKTNISKNLETLKSYKINLKIKYNNYISFVHGVWNALDNESKFTLHEQITSVRNKVRLCYDKLQIPLLHAPYILDFINYVDTENNTPVDTDSADIIADIHNIFHEMDEHTLLKLCSSHINKPYAGDPLGLKSFVDSIRLLSTFATTENLRVLLVSFIKTRIEAKARDFINDTHNNTALIIEALQTNIKFDNSKVIEGRMLSITNYNMTGEDFANKVEELSDAFRRSLIIEGISPNKATEMAVDKTVELCRKNTSNSTVKAVLAATKFESSKEVVAKLVTETSIAKNEHSVLRFNATNKTRGSYNNNRYQRRGQFAPRTNNRFANGNRFHSNGNNRRYNNNNNNPRGGRQFSNRTQNNNNRTFNRNVRSFGPENQSGPQQISLGAQGQTNGEEH